MAQGAVSQNRRDYSNSRRKRIRVSPWQGEVLRRVLQHLVTDHEARKEVGLTYDDCIRTLEVVERDLAKHGGKKSVPAQGKAHDHAPRS